MHDPRIGRFFAIDPLAPKYPHNSPYAFSENRVIDGVELEGLEFEWYLAKNGIFGETVQHVVTEVDAGAASWLSETGQGLLHLGYLSSGMATDQEYYQTFIGLVAMNAQTNNLSPILSPVLENSEVQMFKDLGAAMNALQAEDQARREALARGDIQEWTKLTLDFGSIFFGAGEVKLATTPGTTAKVVQTLNFTKAAISASRRSPFKRFVRWTKNLFNKEARQAVKSNKRFAKESANNLNLYERISDGVSDLDIFVDAYEDDFFIVKGKWNDVEIEFQGYISIENKTLTLKSADFGGEVGMRNVRHIVGEFGKHMNVDDVHVIPGTRTTGANPGHTPSPFTVTSNL